MAKFGRKSLSKLKTCHSDLRVIAHEAINDYDFTFIFGYRTPAFQFGLFKKGRKKINGVWKIVDKKKVVTHKDGYVKKSRHNSFPSTAMDLGPWPLDWEDKEEFSFLAGHIMSVANRLFYEGRIKNKLFWGARWRSFKDYPHFQLRKPIK